MSIEKEIHLDTPKLGTTSSGSVEDDRPAGRSSNEIPANGESNVLYYRIALLQLTGPVSMFGKHLNKVKAFLPYITNREGLQINPVKPVMDLHIHFSELTIFHSVIINGTRKVQPVWNSPNLRYLVCEHTKNFSTTHKDDKLYKTRALSTSTDLIIHDFREVTLLIEEGKNNLERRYQNTYLLIARQSSKNFGDQVDYCLGIVKYPKDKYPTLYGKVNVDYDNTQPLPCSLKTEGKTAAKFFIAESMEPCLKSDN